jgi:hypothetical protein
MTDTKTMTNSEIRKAFEQFLVDVKDDPELRGAFEQFLFDRFPRYEFVDRAERSTGAQRWLDIIIEDAKVGDVEKMDFLVSEMDAYKDQLKA